MSDLLVVKIKFHDLQEDTYTEEVTAANGHWLLASTVVTKWQAEKLITEPEPVLSQLWFYLAAADAGLCPPIADDEMPTFRGMVNFYNRFAICEPDDTDDDSDREQATRPLITESLQGD